MDDMGKKNKPYNHRVYISGRCVYTLYFCWVIVGAYFAMDSSPHEATLTYQVELLAAQDGKRCLEFDVSNKLNIIPWVFMFFHVYLNIIPFDSDFLRLVHEGNVNWIVLPQVWIAGLRYLPCAKQIFEDDIRKLKKSLVDVSVQRPAAATTHRLQLSGVSQTGAQQPADHIDKSIVGWWECFWHPYSVGAYSAYSLHYWWWRIHVFWIPLFASKIDSFHQDFGWILRR